MTDFPQGHLPNQARDLEVLELHMKLDLQAQRMTACAAGAAVLKTAGLVIELKTGMHLALPDWGSVLLGAGAVFAAVKALGTGQQLFRQEGQAPTPPDQV